MELLHVYDKALQLMFQKSPGFAPVWQTTVQEAEREIAQYQKGIIPFVRRLINPSSQKYLDAGPGGDDAEKGT